MLNARRLVPTVLTGAVLAVGFSADALAAANPAEFGQAVAECAQTHLGQRPNPPSVTCTHDGTTMTFPTFGAMVTHMRAEHG